MGLVIVGLFLFVAYRLLVKSGSQRGTPFFDRAVDDIGKGEHGVLLTALALWAVWEAMELAPSVGVWLGFVLLTAVGFVVAPSWTKTVVGVGGTLAAVRGILEGGCRHPGTSELLVLSAAAGFLMLMSAAAAFHLFRSMTTRARFGDIFIGTFGGLEVLAFADHPAGFDLIEAELQAWVWTGIFICLAVIAALIVAAPEQTASLLGVGVAMAELSIDLRVGHACHGLAGLGVAFVLAMLVLVLLVRYVVGRSFRLTSR